MVIQISFSEYPVRMRVYQITKSRKRARGSSSESTEFQDQLVEPLSARSYRMFLPRISQVPDLNGRQNKFSGDTRVFPFVVVVAKSNDGRSSCCSDFNVGRSHVQLRPKPVCRTGLAETASPIGDWANDERRSSCTGQHVF